MVTYVCDIKLQTTFSENGDDCHVVMHTVGCNLKLAETTNRVQLLNDVVCFFGSGEILDNTHVFAFKDKHRGSSHVKSRFCVFINMHLKKIIQFELRITFPDAGVEYYSFNDFATIPLSTVPLSTIPLSTISLSSFVVENREHNVNFVLDTISRDELKKSLSPIVDRKNQVILVNDGDLSFDE
jgi:hypothetical protein